MPAEIKADMLLVLKEFVAAVRNTMAREGHRHFNVRRRVYTVTQKITSQKRVELLCSL